MGVPNIPVTWLKHNKGCGHPSELGYVGCTAYSYESPCDTMKRDYALQSGRLSLERLDKDGMITRQAQLDFTSPIEFWDTVIARGRKRTPLWLFAHNWSEVFTFVGGWRYLRQGQLGFEASEVRFDPDCEPPEIRRKWKGLFIDNDPPVVFQLWTRRGCKLFLVDLRNYLPQSVEKLAERLGVSIPPALPGWQDTTFTRKRAKAIADTVRQSVLGLIEEHRDGDHGNWALTAAGLAWRSFRHQHYSGCIATHAISEVKELERNGYYGGLLEAYKIGKIAKPCIQLDVNGMYPWAMRSFDLPCQLIDSWIHSPQNEPSPDTVSEDYICEVELYSPVHTFPVRLSGRGLCQCRGRFATVLCGPELIRASRAGVITAIRRWARFKRWRWGKRHVDYWHERRLQSRAANDPIGDAFANSQMHCLYGRFAMRSFPWQPLSEVMTLPQELAQLTNQEVLKWIWLTEGDDGKRISIVGDPELGDGELRRVGNHWELARPPAELPGSLPAICAWITAYCRERMRRLRGIAGLNESFYCSTDSLICSHTGRDALADAGQLCPETLGMLKTEAEGDSAEIRGIHRYTIGDKVVNGSRPVAIPWIGSPETTEVVSHGMKTLIKTGQSALVKRRLITVSRDIEYRKGNVMLDGWVEPITL